MSSSAERRAAREIQRKTQLPYTMALRLLRETKDQYYPTTWSALAEIVITRIEGKGVNTDAQ